MSSFSQRNVIITLSYIAVLTIASVFIFNSGYKPNYRGEKGIPTAKNGFLDLSKHDFSKNNIIKLLGDAEFYYSRLLNPSDFNDSTPIVPDGLISLHGVWNDFKVQDVPINGKGVATYKYTIKVPDNNRYGFKIKEFDCAYKIWINNNDSALAGRVSKDEKDYIPSWKRNEVFVNAVNNKLIIVLQVANYSHRKGGPEDAILFGLEKDIRNYKISQIGVNYFLFGILLIMAIYHLVLYFYRSKDLSILWFSLLNFATTLRLVTTGEKIMLDLFPNIPWIVAVRIEYISYMVGVPFFLIFMQSLCKKEIKLFAVYLIASIALILSAFVLITPSTIFSYTPIFYQGIVAVVALYVLIALSVAMFRKREHSFVLFGGYVFFFIIVINDILYYNKVVNTSFLMPLGLFALVFSQAFVLSKKTSKAYTEVENLSQVLDGYSKELELMVEERVTEIKNQNEKIEDQKETLVKQANQLKQINQKLRNLDKFKENMTHMIVHDLKNPINVILHQTKDEIIHEAARQMLLLVQNILDVQKYEETKLELKLEKHTVSQVIKSAIEQVRVLIELKKIKLLDQVNTELELTFDSANIERVVLNLLTNAITYAPAGGEIKLSYKIIPGFIRVEVYNNGYPVPEEERRSIFTRYSANNGKKSFFTTSTGLGLTFCKIAIDAHNGQIDFVNHPDKGVTFWFTIPLSPNAEKSFKQYSHFENIEQAEASEDSPIKLAQNDITYLKKHKDQIHSLQIFEVTKLKSLLRNIDKDYSAGVANWIRAAENAVDNLNEAKFQKLLLEIS